jgi:hypothetical protein
LRHFTSESVELLLHKHCGLGRTVRFLAVELQQNQKKKDGHNSQYYNEGKLHGNIGVTQNLIENGTKST